MAFHSVRLSTAISNEAVGGPEFHTNVVVTKSGQSQRNVNWTQARHKYNIRYGVKTDTDINSLLAFFYARQGRAHSFRFRDVKDHSGTSQLCTKISSTKYQIVRRYASSGTTFVRTIRKPTTVGISVTDNGAARTAGVHYTVNSSNGRLTWTTVPSTIVKCTFTFDVPVNFQDDYLPLTAHMSNISSIQDIWLIEDLNT